MLKNKNINFKKRLTMVIMAVMMVLPAAFLLLNVRAATEEGEYFSYAVSDLEYSEEEQEFMMYLTAGKDMDLFSVGGEFSDGNVDSGLKEFELKEMIPSEEFKESDIVSNEDGKFSWLANGDDEVVSFSKGDVIWTAVYTVSSRTRLGEFDFEISDIAAMFAENGGEISDIKLSPYVVIQAEIEPEAELDGTYYYDEGDQIRPTDVTVTAEFNGETITLKRDEDFTLEYGDNNEVGEETGEIIVKALDMGAYKFDDILLTFKIWGHQEISYAEESIYKTYGDEPFINPLTVKFAEGEITYKSTNPEYATVDENTGEVTIIKPGMAAIIATAAATDDYTDVQANYGIMIAKKEVNVARGEVNNKTYDGTKAAEAVRVHLDDDNLTAGDDYTATAEFVSPDATNNSLALITATLSEEAAEYYDLVQETLEATANIAPFPVVADNAKLSQNSYVFNGAVNRPDTTITVKLDGETETALSMIQDYDVEFPDDGLMAGVNKVKVTTRGNYTGEFELSYEITKKQIEASDVSLRYDAVRYDGKAKEPTVSVTVGTMLLSPDEYAVSYNNNTNPTDKAEVIVTATDKDLTGAVTVYFEIMDKEELVISGISDNQMLTYTGKPVELKGELTVGANNDNITVNDLTTTWYAADGMTVISQPTNAGTYRVVYTYNGINYMGSKGINFTIARAVSPEPAETMAGLTGLAGASLSEIAGERTLGFSWDEPTEALAKGQFNYAASYAYNNDPENYTVLELSVPVYGLTTINIETSVDTGEGKGTILAPATAVEGTEYTVTFAPEDGYEVYDVKVNTLDVTSSVSNNKLTLTAGTTYTSIKASFRKVYTVLEGDGKSYTLGEADGAKVKIDADLELFSEGGEVYVDGMLIGNGYYNVTSGSTVITFTAAFLERIGAGTHEVVVAFNDGGVARATFTIQGSTDESSEDAVAAPETGFFTGANGGAVTASMLTSAFALTGLVIFAKKKFVHKSIDFNK